MDRRGFMATATGGVMVAAGAGRLARQAGAASAASPGGGKPPRPSVVLILTDDQGWGDIRSHGNDKIDTPVLDKLAADGARFDRFFVSPLCAPTRASLLTGRHFTRIGVSGVCGGAEVMAAEEVTVAQLLKHAGYATGCFGKWHNGECWPYHPNARGFEEFYGFCGGHWDNYFDTTLERNGKPEKMTGYITDVITDEAIRFIEANRDRPFFCYVPYNAPHDPMQVPQRYRDKYAARKLDAKTAAVYAMVENVDDNVGRLLKKLDELKLADNTMVIFITDNGANGDRFNGGMAGAKGSNMEGGCRVPCFIRWPKGIKPGTQVAQIAAHTDILPTLAELCGANEPRTLPLDGKSLVPLLTGAAAEWPDRMIFERGAVRTQRWRFQTGGRGGLYDMPADGGQKTNVARDHPDVVKRLDEAYRQWQAAVTRDAARGTRGITVGHKERPFAYLNAHRARCKGVTPTVKWTSAWLAKWSAGGSLAEWQIEAVAPGQYIVELLCAVPADAVGAKFRVEAGGASAEAALSRAHYGDPLAGRKYPNARPEMDWLAVPLGTLALPKGGTTLRVTAVEVPGKQGIDAKGVLLTRKD